MARGDTRVHATEGLESVLVRQGIVPPIDNKASKVTESNRGREASCTSVHSNVARDRHGWL